MRSHDFGQFLFNSSTFDEAQLIKIIEAAENTTPTLTAKAIFLRIVSLAELTEYLDKSFAAAEDYVRKILLPHQLERIEKLDDGNSLDLLQALIESEIVTLSHLEKILQEYHKVEIPPVENSFAAFYDSVRAVEKIDYPLALSVAESLHDFLSDTFKSTIIFIPSPDLGESEKFGASVKVDGMMPVVVAVMAERQVFHKMSNLYDDFVSDNLDDDFDAMSEMLNVFTGNFAVQFAAIVGVEEEPEPPRFGRVNETMQTLRVLTGFGTFYLYVGKQEIFTAV